MKTHISFKKVFWSFLIIAFLTGSIAFAAPVGKISAIQGRVDVLKVGKNVAVPVSLGALVDVGDIYRTKSKSRAEITFNNNNLMKIAPSTRIEIKEYMMEKENTSAVMRLYRGKVQAVAHQDFVKRAAAFAEGNRFEVHTPNAVAGIRGSDMIVGFTNGTTMVVFISGHGYLYNPASPQVFTPIVAGQVSFITGEGTPTTPVTASDAIISGEVGAFIQVIETKEETEPDGPPGPLTPPPPPEIITGGTTFTGEIYGSTLDDSGDPIGILTGGTFTGNVPDTGTGTLSASGSVLMDGTPTVLEGYIEGTSDKNGAFLGPLAGVQGSWLNRTAALYVEGGQVYFLTGDAPGTLIDSAFSMSGTLAKSASQGTITLTPEPGETLLDALIHSLYEAEAPQFFPNSAFVISNSGIQITPDYFMSTAPSLITNEGKKVAAIGNIYTGSYSPAEVTALPYLGYSDCCVYALGPLFYSHDATTGHFMIDTLLQAIGIDDDIGPYLGIYTMRYFGIYEDADFRMAGAGTFVATPASFFGDWGGDSLYYNYNDSGVYTHAGSDYGYFGGTTAPWTSPASFTAIGTYGLDPADKPHYLMNTYISGSTTEEVSGGIIRGYAAAIWKDGDPENPGTTVGSISGALRALYISTPDANEKVTAGIMKSDIAGSYYPFSTDSGMWGISGTLTPTQLATDLNPDYLYDGYGGMWAVLSGSFGGTGSIYGESGSPYTQWLFLYAGGYSSYESLPFGIFNIDIGYDSYPNYFTDKPTGNPSWSATLGGNGQFGQNSEDEGYYLATISGTWTDTGEITGNVTGNILTPVLIYDMEGKFTGVNSGTDDGTWIGQVIGSYTGTPTDFGGSWYHCLLYDDYEGFLSWNSERNEGVFGFIKRTDGNYNFLAIGEFDDYGYVSGGGPYIWSGNMGYGGVTADRDIAAFTGGIWKKADPYDAFGTMSGYVSAVYYTEDGKAGLIKGNITGNFYEMYYDDGMWWGMWKAQSGTSGLTTVDKTASLPEGFDVSTASTSGGPLYAYSAGSFAGSAETGNTIFGGDYDEYSHTLFITYTDGVSKSLPFGIYNLKLTGYDEDYGNYYYGKPAGTSVSWSAKIGSAGYFDNNSEWGYWLANIAGTWDQNTAGSPEPGTEDGSISGNLSGKYITLTHLGTIQGPFYGLYRGSSSTSDGVWAGMSVGTYEATTPLTTSMVFSTEAAQPVTLWRAMPGNYYEADFTQYDGESGQYLYYKFRYIETDGMGIGKVQDDYAMYPEKYYFPSGTMFKKDENGDIVVSSWDIGDIEEIRNLFYSGSSWDPNNSSFTPTHYEESSSFLDVLEKRYDDYLSAILGMTGYPWNTGGTPVTIIGEYFAYGSDYTTPTIVTTPLLFGTFYTPHVDGGTPIGAYGVTMGGFISNDTRGVQIAMRGLYVGPDNATAGVLRGLQVLTGSFYEDINMWDAEGTLVATVMNSSFASNPEEVTMDNLSDNIVNGFIGSQIMGHFTGDSDSIIGTPFANTGTTRNIKGQDWGIMSSTIWAGGFGVTSTTLPGTWSVQVGGEGQFGEYKDASDSWQADMGIMLIPTLSGTLTGGVMKASYTSTVGQFITMTKMGTISDVGLLGVYTQPSPVTPNTLYSWQGVLGGVWNTTQYFTFASSFNVSNKRFAELHSGGYTNGSYNEYYYYYDNDAGYGDINFFSDADRTYITQRKYQPDSGPFNDRIWREYTYEKGANTFSGYDEGTTDYPSSFSDAFFSALAERKEYPAYNYSSTWWNFVQDGSISAIMGGVGDLWTATASSPATVYFLGDYDHWYGKPTIFGAEIVSYNVKNDTNTTLDGKGTYYGYIGGREIDNAIDGRIYAIYLDPTAEESPAGILKGSFTGTVYTDIEMWAGQGSIYPIYLMDVNVSLESFSSHLHTRSFDSTSGSTSFTLNGNVMHEELQRPFVYQGEGTTFDAAEGSWGVWKSALGGKYTGITLTDSWTASITYTDSTRIIGNEAKGTKGSGNKIEGTTIGYGADIEPEQTYTWVSVGEVKGTFNPTLYTFQLGVMGVSVETNTYLTLARTSAGRTQLQALGIPAVQVGVDTLTGSGNGFSAIAMNDVKFFATTAGGKPSVWATDSVTGTYTAPPSTSTPISMTGSTLSASFNFTNWNPGNNGKWLGSVSGTGGFNGSTTFSGAAAGTGATSVSGSITGTAAGVAK